MGWSVFGGHTWTVGDILNVEPTAIEGLSLIYYEQHDDDRGSFSRIFDAKTFANCGLPIAFAQHGCARNRRAGTIRGLHYQLPPYEEHKIVKVVSGAVLDVVVDVRPESPTFKRCEYFNLSSDLNLMLSIAQGLAHGYQTLTDHTDLHYLITTEYSPDHAAGITPIDPILCIRWPLPVSAMSERDRGLPQISSLN